MGEMGTRQISLGVPYATRILVAQVLIEATTQGNIYDLHTTADAKYGDIFFERPGSEGQFELIELRIGLFCEWVLFFPITSRLHIHATWKQQSIQAGEYRIMLSEVVEHGDKYWHS